jgi:hypothetical protein
MFILHFKMTVETGMDIDIGMDIGMDFKRFGHRV